ncbi:MAG: DNA-3-methyladenine glycosylase [Humibacillus sp.]
MTRLGRDFFARPVLEVAPDLLGCVLVRAEVRVRITETEAYAGELDPASRVLRRRTAHNDPVHGEAGLAFVYFTYGHHWMLCLGTDGPGVPNVVLVRAGEVVGGEPVVRGRRGEHPHRDLARGPGRLTRALGIEGGHSGLDVCRPAVAPPADLHVSAAPTPRGPVAVGPRVGVRGPGGDGAAYPWRFWLEGEPTVSPYRAAAARQRDARPSVGTRGQPGGPAARG